MMKSAQQETEMGSVVYKEAQRVREMMEILEGGN